jgi:hypothetical protein
MTGVGREGMLDWSGKPGKCLIEDSLTEGQHHYRSIQIDCEMIKKGQRKYDTGPEPGPEPVA